jgi:hypothetical protein
VALQRLGEQLGVAVPFRTYADLAEQLRNRPLLERRTANMRAARHDFAFDTHVPALVGLFRTAMARRERAVG